MHMFIIINPVWAEILFQGLAMNNVGTEPALVTWSRIAVFL